MHTDTDTTNSCCFCGQIEPNMTFKATCPDGHLICAGWCQTGLMVDTMGE